MGSEARHRDSVTNGRKVTGRHTELSASGSRTTTTHCDGDSAALWMDG